MRSAHASRDVAPLRTADGLESKHATELCFTEGGDAMARSSRDFADIAQQNAQGAVQATGWMHAVAEQNLNQSKAAFESLLAMARNALRSMDQQSSAIRERSIG